jgi:hypothetical protein
VRRVHDNRENNEVVEFRVAHQYYEIHVVAEICILRSLDCLQPRGMIVTFGQTSGAIDPIAPVLLSQKGSLFLTRPVLFHYIERRDALEASASELFEVVPSGKVALTSISALRSSMLQTPTRHWKRAQPRAPPS